MEPENPIAAYNDFLRATLAKETRAREILRLVTMDDDGYSDDEVFEIAQCLALADWQEHEQLPLVVLHKAQRHLLRNTIQDLTERGCLLPDEERFSVLIQEIDAIVVKFRTVFERVKRSCV